MIRENKIALSFDVEDWYHTPVITGSSFSKYKSTEHFFKDWKGQYDCLSDGFYYLIDTLEKYNIRATFFMVADVIDRYPGIISRLKQSKHEIACHSLFHHCSIDAKTRKPLQSIEEWENELMSAKNKIETAFGVNVTGYRAPGAYFGKWMVKILERSGFLYDSSIAFNSLYNKTDVPLKNIPSVPYLLNSENLSPENADTSLVELPWCYFKMYPFVFPGGGAFFYRAFGNMYFNILLNQCLKKGDTMFYLHPLDFSNTPIPIGNNRLRPMYWINKGEATRRMFEKFLNRYQGKLTTCNEVYSRFKAINSLE